VVPFRCSIFLGYTVDIACLLFLLIHVIFLWLFHATFVVNKRYY